jgi:hypothetical protein
MESHKSAIETLLLAWMVGARGGGEPPDDYKTEAKRRSVRSV